MSNIKGVDPAEAAELLAKDFVYLDVRSEPEFEAGHPPGALNVPLMHAGPAGMTPNPEFLEVMQASFGRTEKLLLGCRSGARSRRAAEMLEQAGYETLADLVTGFDGSRDAFGRPTAGWKAAHPVETGAPEGQRYSDVKTRAAK